MTTEITRETVTALAERIGVRMLVAFGAPANPNMDDMPAESKHWLVTLELDGRTLDTPYSMGPAFKDGPTTSAVLGSLIMDASGYDDARTFENWCAMYGYDTDSRKAERTYNAVAEATKALRSLLGEHYEHALWETDSD